MGDGPRFHSSLFLGTPLSHATVGVEEKRICEEKIKSTEQECDCETSTVGRESNCKSQSLVLYVYF